MSAAIDDASAAGMWICSDCGARCGASGDCNRCGQGPLVDIRNPNVREVLLEDEQRRREKRSQRTLAISVVLMVLAWLSLGLVSFPLMIAALSMPGGLIFVGMLIVGALVTWKILDAIFPVKPRFPYLR